MLKENVFKNYRSPLCCCLVTTSSYCIYFYPRHSRLNCMLGTQTLLLLLLLLVLTVSAPWCWCWVGPGPLIAHSEGRSVSVGFQVTFCITRGEGGSSEIFTSCEGKNIFPTSSLGFNYFSNVQ